MAASYGRYDNLAADPVKALEYVEAQIANATRELAHDAPASWEPDDGISF